MAQSGGRGTRGKGRRADAAPRGVAGAGGAAEGPEAEAAPGAGRPTGARKTPGAGKAASAAAKAAAASAPQAAPRRPGGAGFRQVGLFARGPIREAAARQGFAETRVLTDWAAIAGAELSSLCRPVRVTYAGKGVGATLIVLAAGARAPEVEMLGPRIVERVNAHYGYRAVSRMKVVQTDRGLSPSRGSDGAGGDGPVPAAITEDTRRRAADAAEGAESPELRAALERLALGWLARRPREGREA